MPEPTPKPARRRQVDRSAETRSLLLDTALALVGEKGVDGATIQELAQRAGMTPGAVQHHFPNKLDLMLSLLDRIFNSGIDEGGVWPDPRAPLAVRAASFVNALWERSYSTPRFMAAWNLYLRLCTDEQTRTAIKLRRHLANQRLHLRFLEVFPELAPGPAAETLLQLIFTVLRGLGIQRVFGDEEAAETAQKAMVVELLLDRCSRPA